MTPSKSHLFALAAVLLSAARLPTGAAAVSPTFATAPMHAALSDAPLSPLLQALFQQPTVGCGCGCDADDSSALQPFVPDADVVVNEEDGATILAMDLPGVPLEDVSLALEDSGALLTVKGERRASLAGDGGYRESWSGAFERTFELSQRITDAAAIQATLADGILVIALPAHEAPVTTSIPISRGESSKLPFAYTTMVSVEEEEEEEDGSEGGGAEADDNGGEILNLDLEAEAEAEAPVTAITGGLLRRASTAVTVAKNLQKEEESPSA